MGAFNLESHLSERTVSADCRGPLRLACQEIRAAVDYFTIWQRRERQVRRLVKRTDQMLDELETLNLLHVRRVPTSLRSKVADLGAELLIQEDLFTFARGHELADIELLVAS